MGSSHSRVSGREGLKRRPAAVTTPTDAAAKSALAASVDPAASQPPAKMPPALATAAVSRWRAAAGPCNRPTHNVC